MSSTDDQAFEAAGRLFRDHAVPAGESLRARGVELLPGDEPGAATHWRAHPGTSLVRADDGTDVGAALAARWRDEGLGELVPLAEGLSQIAERLQQADTPEEEISPYIYAMF